MRTRAIILVCTLLIAAPLLARDKSDVIVMKNGDRMTCEIKGLDSLMASDDMSGPVVPDYRLHEPEAVDRRLQSLRCLPRDRSWVVRRGLQSRQLHHPHFGQASA